MKIHFNVKIAACLWTRWLITIYRTHCNFALFRFGMFLWHNCLHKCRGLMPQHTIKKKLKKIPSLCCSTCRQYSLQTRAINMLPRSALAYRSIWRHEDKWMLICVTCHVSVFVMPNGEETPYLASLWHTVCVCTNRTGGCFLLQRDIDYSFNRMQQMLQLKWHLINFLVSCHPFPSRRFLKHFPRNIYINV